MSSVFVTRANCGSTCESSPRRPCATQTAPLPSARPVGVRSSSDTVPAKLRCFASTSVSVRSSRLPTQTAPPPAATGPGRFPVGISATHLVRRRIDHAHVVRLDRSKPAAARARREERDRGDRGDKRRGGNCQDGGATPRGTGGRHRGGLCRRARSNRREALRQLGPGHLVEAHWPVEVLEPLLAEVAEEEVEVLLLVLEERLRRLGDEHLATVRGSPDARGAVHGEARVAAVGSDRLAGVDAHAHAHLGAVRPLVADERELTLDRRQHGVTRA